MCARCCAASSKVLEIDEARLPAPLPAPALLVPSTGVTLDTRTGAAGQDACQDVGGRRVEGDQRRGGRARPEPEHVQAWLQ